MLDIQEFSANLLTGKTALVTGAARGIGLSIVQRLSDIGARVVLADCDQIGVCAAEKLAQIGREALPMPVDVACAEATAAGCLFLTSDLASYVTGIILPIGLRPSQQGVWNA